MSLPGIRRAERHFRRIPRIPLIVPFTPVEPCPALRRALPPGAPEIYVKRDDYQSYCCGGNKLRKLEFIMADALAAEATAIVTVGGIHSNHARVTAQVARRLGMRCLLVLNGEPPANPAGNALINRELGVEVVYVARREDREPRMLEAAAELAKRGERVYTIPLGSSNEIGSLGFVAALQEVLAQQKKMRIGFDAVVLASSSGGTQAGLEVGKRLLGLEALEILGVSPDDPAAMVRDNVLRAALPLMDRLGMRTVMKPEDIRVDDNFCGEAYGISTPESNEAARLWAREEGILLDPVYTAKAAAGFLDYIRRGRFGPDQKVLFWHTGGLLNLFNGQEP